MGNFARAALESVAYSVKANLEHLEATSGQSASIVALGGGMTRSGTLGTMVADVLGRKVRLSPHAGCKRDWCMAVCRDRFRGVLDAGWKQQDGRESGRRSLSRIPISPRSTSISTPDGWTCRTGWTRSICEAGAMKLNWQEERQAVLVVAQKMAARGLVVGTSGNVSRRLGGASDGRELMAITPSGVEYDSLKAEGCTGHRPGYRASSGRWRAIE